MVQEEVIAVNEISEEEINRKIRPKRRKVFSTLWTVFLILITLVAIPVTYVDLVYTPVYIDGESMAPTLNNPDSFKDYPPLTNNDQYVETGLMNETKVARNHLKRGDIIVFETKASQNESTPTLYIKRIIALPGEEIFIVDNRSNQDDVHIKTVDDETFILDEKYLTEVHKYQTAVSDSGYGISAPFTLGEGQYFVMGDNRDNSTDSRIIGAVDFYQVRGKLFIINGYAIKKRVNNKYEITNRSYYSVWKWRFY